MKITKGLTCFTIILLFALMWGAIFIFRPNYLETVGMQLILTIGGVAIAYITLQVADNTLKGKNYRWELDPNMKSEKEKNGNSEHFPPESEEK